MERLTVLIISMTSVLGVIALGLGTGVFAPRASFPPARRSRGVPR